MNPNDTMAMRIGHMPFLGGNGAEAVLEKTEKVVVWRPCDLLRNPLISRFLSA